MVGTWIELPAEGPTIGGKPPPQRRPASWFHTAEGGRFIYLYTRSDLPKVASNSRATTTPQEGAEISQGSIATYGTYTFADKTLKVKVDHSTYANWNGAEQTRTLSSRAMR